jgi:hypothetical protein
MIGRRLLKRAAALGTLPVSPRSVARTADPVEELPLAGHLIHTLVKLCKRPKLPRRSPQRAAVTLMSASIMQHFGKT